MSDNPTRPNEKLNITVKGQPHTVFMSAGLLRRLVGMTKVSEGGIIDLYSDPYLQSFVMTEMLLPRNTPDEQKEKTQIDDFELSLEDAEKLVNFAIDHVSYFFSAAANKLQLDMTEGHGLIKTVTALQESLTGLAPSTETKPSAGPTIAA